MAQERGDAGTEQLRKAAISYRSLVQALLEDKPEEHDRNGSANPSERSGEQPEQRREQRSQRSDTDDRSKA